MKKLILIVVSIILICGCSRKKEYLVVFDSNGGSNINSVKVTEGSSITKPDDPTKDGYTFDGWYLDNTKYDFKLKINKDIILKANWLKTSGCNLTCDTGYKLDKSSCSCVKTSNYNVTSIDLNKTSLNIEVGEKYTLKASVRPSDIPFVEISWQSSNSNIATVNDGVVVGVNVGSAIITAFVGDVKTSINVVVSNQKNKILTKAANSISSKKLTKGNTSINFSYSGCTITNTNNTLSSNVSKTTISDGVVTLLYRSINKGTITSDYTIKCGSDTAYKNGVVHEIVASPYTYEANLQDVVYIIKVSDAEYYTLNNDLKYRESRGGVQTGVSNYTEGEIFEMQFNNDSSTIYEVKEAK